MRVLHVTQPVDAGVAAVVLELAVDQRARGWSVDIACPPSGWLVQQARDAGVPVHAWRATRSPGPRSVTEAVHLGRLVDRLAPDVVHLHSAKAGLAGRLAIRARRTTVFQPHMWSFTSAGGPVGRAALTWERLAARWTHQLLCVSDDELAFGRAAGVEAAATVICNGVDTDRLRPSDRRAARSRLDLAQGPIAVCVGRLVGLKGQDQLLTAWPDILARVPDARLVLVGDGPMGDTWRAGYPVATHPSVVWTGHQEAPSDYYAAADVVVLPSRAEGMALVPLEAMSCGRPVVAFDVSGARQSVGDAGAILPPGDLASLAAAVAQRLADPALAAAEGRIGRQRAVQLFDRRRVTDQVAALVSRLAGETTASGSGR